MRIFRHCNSKQFKSFNSLTPSSYYSAVALLPLLASSSFVTAETIGNHNRSFSSSASCFVSPLLQSTLFHNIGNKGEGLFKYQKGVTSRNTMSSSASSNVEVVQVPCLDDNYGYIIHDKSTGHTAVVDTPDAGPYQRELDQRGWKLTHILNTHHHWDHTGANLELKKAFDNVMIYGPVNESSKIPGIDVKVGSGDTFTFGSCDDVQVLDVGGHTKGHIAYYFPSQNNLFCGDALFALGCGRMFEGTPSQFWSSLQTLRSLPDETSVYCAHEYTMGNAKFAMSVEPNNVDLVARFKDVQDKRSKGLPTVPSLMGDEKKTNPFLRVDISDEIRQNVGATPDEDNSSVWAKVRNAKDTFRG